jgi:hypothetical protein
VDIKIYENGTISSLETKDEESFEMDQKFAQVAYFESEEINDLAVRALQRVRIANDLFSDEARYDRSSTSYAADIAHSITRRSK